jgi:transposase-like protein
MQYTAQYSPDSTLTPAQHRILSLLAQGASINQAAAAAGIHRNTVANWRRTVPAFAREFEFAARERALFWHDQASALAPKAIEVLNTILNDETAAPSLRLRAALKVISMATEIKPNPAFAAPPAETTEEAPQEAPQAAAPENVAAQPAKTVHNPAQSRTNQPHRRPAQPGRNTPCPCGSGVKFKRCCANRPAAALAMAS